MSTTQPCDSDPPCTATVETLYGMGTEPENAEVVIGEEGSYPKDMFFLMVTVIAIIIILLVVHALYRLSLCCRHCFCRPGTKKGEKCCCCIETSTRGKKTALAFKLGLAVILAAVVASLLSYTAGQAMISEAVADIADSLDQLSDFLGRLQQILGDMVESVTDMTHGVGDIACNADALTMASKEDPVPGYVADLTDTNTTIAAMTQAIHDMKKTVDGFKDKVRDSAYVEAASTWRTGSVHAIEATPVSRSSRGARGSPVFINTGRERPGRVGHRLGRAFTCYFTLRVLHLPYVVGYIVHGL